MRRLRTGTVHPGHRQIAMGGSGSRPKGGNKMPRLLRTSGSTLAIAVAMASYPMVASANDELMKLEQDPNLWVHPAGDYANTRYSALDQITRFGCRRRPPADRKSDVTGQRLSVRVALGGRRFIKKTKHNNSTCNLITQEI